MGVSDPRFDFKYRVSDQVVGAGRVVYVRIMDVCGNTEGLIQLGVLCYKSD